MIIILIILKKNGNGGERNAWGRVERKVREIVSQNEDSFYK